MASATPTPNRISGLARFTAYATWLCWMALLAGTTYWPELDQHPTVLTVWYGLVAVGTPMTILFGIQHGMKASNWKASCVLVLAGGIPFFTIVTNHVIRAQAIDQWSYLIMDLDIGFHPPQEGILVAAREEDSEESNAERRKMLASMIYNIWGFEVMWRNEGGELEVFVPNEREVRERKESMQLNVEMAQSARDLERAETLQWGALVLHLTAFFVVFFPGLLVLIWRQRKLV
ncbi:MAG: hypothetical protein COA70_10405 [Planctomycetota bacterium]|nr:MAG: hypothetical protein COA70_10405 [Planctomycetota bacterium]